MQEDLLNNFWTFKKSFTDQNQWNFTFYWHLKKCTVVWQKLRKWQNLELNFYSSSTSDLSLDSLSL